MRLSGPTKVIVATIVAALVVAVVGYALWTSRDGADLSVAGIGEAPQPSEGAGIDRDSFNLDELLAAGRPVLVNIAGDG